jgi:hypothetical protein
MILARPVLVIVAADADAYAAVGARIYSHVLRQRPTYPAVVVQTIPGTPHGTKSGPSTVDELRVQIDVYADENTAGGGLTAADDAAEKLRVALDYYRGDLTYSGVTWAIDGISCLVPPHHAWNEDPEVFRVMSEYKFRIKRDGLTGAVGSSGLQYFTDDAAAAAGGVAVGRAYIIAEGSDVGPAGVVKIRMY